MAKQNGIIRLRGTIDGVTFSQTRHGYLAKSKGGVDKARIQSDPVFQRTRENMNEFGLLARAGKYLRHSVKLLTHAASDVLLNERVIKLLTKIRNEDHTNGRGLRNVETALATPAVKNMFAGFEFNDRTHLQNVLLHPFSLDVTSGMVTFTDLDVVNQIIFPPAATHVNLTAGWTRINFTDGSYERSISDPLVLGRNAATSTHVLTPPLPPSGSGILTLFILRVGFSQLMNGIHYPLSDGEGNAVCVIGVG